MVGTTDIEQITGWVARLMLAPGCVEELQDKTAAAARLRGWLDAVTARLALFADELAAQGQGPGTAALLADAGRMSARDARQVAARADVQRALPEVGVALSEGRIGVAHVDAIAGSARRLPAAARSQFLEHGSALLATAPTMTPDEFRQHCDEEARRHLDHGGLGRLERQRQASFLRRWRDKDTGMHCGRWALDDERGQRLSAAIDAELEALWSEHPSSPHESTETVLEQLGAQALVNIAGHGHATRRPTPDVAVLIDYQTLVGDLHDHSLCELADGTPIPVGTARRLACSANVFAVVLDGESVRLDLGREIRVANRAQRRALRAMYRTCAGAGCDVPFDRCEIHHVLPFEKWGLTDLANLLPLCWRHHHMAHEGGWAFQLDAERTLTITRPDGVVHAVIPFRRAERWQRRHRPREGVAPSTGGSDPPRAATAA